MASMLHSGGLRCTRPLLTGGVPLAEQAETVRGNTAFTDEVVFPALAELTGLPEAALVPLAKFRHLTTLARALLDSEGCMQWLVPRARCACITPCCTLCGSSA